MLNVNWIGKCIHQRSFVDSDTTISGRNLRHSVFRITSNGGWGTKPCCLFSSKLHIETFRM